MVLYNYIIACCLLQQSCLICIVKLITRQKFSSGMIELSLKDQFPPMPALQMIISQSVKACWITTIAERIRAENAVNRQDRCSDFLAAFSGPFNKGIPLNFTKEISLTFQLLNLTHQILQNQAVGLYYLQNEISRRWCQICRGGLTKKAQGRGRECVKT